MKPTIDLTCDSLSDDSEASPSKPTSSTPVHNLSPIPSARKLHDNVEKNPVQDKDRYY